jgi:CheY-like chemotaxis protein
VLPAAPPLTAPLVDDNPAVLDFMAAASREAGHEVAEASSGRARSLFWRWRRFDAAVLDYARSGMNGVMLAGARRAPAAGPADIACDGGRQCRRQRGVGA